MLIGVGSDADRRARLLLYRVVEGAILNLGREEGRLYNGAWLTTRCAAHAEGRPPVPPRAGFENMHIVRHLVGGKRHVTCRRYDRERDVFVDVDPASLGIGEE